MRSPRHLFSVLLILLLPCPLSAAPGDADNDGLRDAVETNTGVFFSADNTGTNPNLADTDGDSLPDGLELNLGTNPTSAASKVKRPNIIYILADDLGYGDVGCFWQNQRTGTNIWKFATPGLDTMASQGAMLTHHYVGAPICASSRCSFLQGRHQGHADIRDNQFDKALPDCHNISSVLKAAGYRTIHVGKAGLAGTVANPLQNSSSLAAHPLKRGFGRFFGYLRHNDGHEHYPRNGTASRLAVIHDDYTPVTGAYQDLFTSDAFTGFAKKSIIEETQQHPERPFFLYLSFDTPHFYGETSPTANYPAGRGLNGGIQWTGPPSYVNTATNDPNKVDNIANKDSTVGSSWYPAAQKYVSMIRRMDDSVADILQTLRDLGIDNNTLVVFTSDNGPSPTEVYPPTFQSYAGFEGIKMDLWEGGIRVPTIAWWPDNIPATNNLANIRQISHPCANYDWLATFAGLARVAAPSFTDGTSLVPTLTGKGIQADRGYLYFEYAYGSYTGRYPDFVNHGGEIQNQMQAIRVGDFKGIRYNITSASDPFRIYNVVNDPKEGTDLAASRPDLVEKINGLSVSARRKGGGLSRPYDTALIPAVHPPLVEGGLQWKAYEGYWAWLPEFRDLTPASSGLGMNISSSLLSRSNDVGLSFEGYLSVPTSGAYTFQTTSDSTTSLWIHEGHVIDNDFNFTATRTSDPVYLSAGLHPIRLYYRHQGGTASLELKYSGPGISLQKIPASAFFVDGPPPVLLPDTFTTTRNTPTVVDVLANDTASVPLSLVSFGTLSSGTAGISSGKLLYTPSPALIGRDFFTYRATNSVITAESTISATVLFDNEIWFPLDEAAGTSVRQVGGPAPVTGTLTAIPGPLSPWIPGKAGTAIHFGGQDDIVNIPGLDLPMGAASRTFACWMRTAAANPPESQGIFNYGSQGNGNRFTVHLSTTVPGQQTVRLDVDGGSITGSIPVNDGNWHHLAIAVADHNNDGTVNVDETKIYIDGIPDSATATVPQVIHTTGGNIPSFGGSNHAPSYHFSGDLDEIRIFPRALAASEVSALHASQPVNFGTGQPLPDHDGDGYPDYLEVVAGTDPDDPASYLHIHSFTISSGNITIHWAGVVDRTYLVEESADLSTWSPVPGLAPIEVSSMQPDLTATVPSNGAPTRFLRVQARLSESSNSDGDGDGANDLMEFIAGTNPEDPASFFKIHAFAQTPAETTLQWTGVAGRTYQVQESSDLKNWVMVSGIAPIVVTSPQPFASVTVPANGAQKRFLRIQVMMTP